MKPTIIPFLAMLCGAAVYGQGTGTIHGTVADPSGLPIAGARITATLEERHTTRTAQTDDQGAYVLPLLPVGTYTLHIEFGGFKAFDRRGVALNANENARVDARMEIGSLADSVSVTAEAPLIDSRSSTVGSLIDPRRVLELPINGRNVIALAGLLPGAAQVTAPQTFTGDRSGPTISVSGSRGNQNLFLFDGAPFNGVYRNTGLNYPPPDALQEVKVLTNTFSAEYGRNAGSVFNVITKSGSNELHGSAWEFLRNHDLNARNFFAPSQKPQLIQNQFGATAGGPLQKNRLFVFGSYEGLRIRPASLAASAFPLTAAERAGDFSAAKAIKDPTTGQPFADNRIPASRFDPVANTLISRNLMPPPNRPDGQYVTTWPSPQDNNAYLVRVDRNFDKHTVDGHYNYNLARQKSFAGNVPEYLPLSNEARSQSATLGDTFTLRPNLLNQARFSYNRFRASIVNLSGQHLSELGGKLPLFGPKIPPYIPISGRVTLGNNSTVDSIQLNEAFHFSESLTWTRGRHTLKGGFELLRLGYFTNSFYRTMGEFPFTGAFSGNAAADFLLGRPESLTIASPALYQDSVQTNTYYYAQDDWRVHPHLTLNLGLRYELPLPWADVYGYGVTLRPGQKSEVVPTAPVGMVFPGDPGVPRNIVPPDRNNFAPRVGFAWTPFGNNRTSVRGAYGVFYETINADIIQFTASQPFRYNFTFQAPFSLSDPLRGQIAIPTTVDFKNPVFVGTQEVFFMDPTLRSPYVQQFNLNVQREVVRDLAVQVGYVGKVAHKLLFGMSANPAIYGPGATLNNINDRRPLRPYGDNKKNSSEGNSNYHGLQVELNKRFSRGFSVLGVYTFSKSIDQSSNIALGASIPNPLNLRSQYGLSDFYAKHIFSCSWIWDLPRLTQSHSALRAVAGGWQINGLVSRRSGMPVNVTSGADVALSGTPNQRPDVAGNPVLSGGRPRAQKILAWFDRTAFAQPANGTYGNAGRNALIGAPAATTNLGAFKSFALPGREGLRLQFRSEFFNVFNSVNLGPPNTNLRSGATMGRITSADDARVIQFALKLLF